MADGSDRTVNNVGLLVPVMPISGFNAFTRTAYCPLGMVRGSVAVTGDASAVAGTSYFLLVSAELTNSNRNVLPVLNWPVVANGTVSDVPAQSVELANEPVAIVGTRTVMTAVAGLPGKPVPQPLVTAVTW